MSEAMTPADAFVVEPDGRRSAARRLGANRVGLAGVLMQAVAQISPTLGIFYTIAFTTGQAGVTAPLTYLLAFILCLTLAVPLGGLARRLPSAGGYYTYVSEGLGPKTGYMVGWLYGASVALVPAALAAFTGAVLHDELDAEFGFGLPWWVYAVIILALCMFVAFRGIVLSARFMLTMGAYEIVIGLGLALTGIINPGPGGLTARGFLPSHIPSSSGFFLAVVLSIFAFTGFESAANIAEESRNPTRYVPWAITGSVALMGVFYVFCAWGLQVGWGVSNLTALANSPTAPAFVLGHRLWGAAWILILIALLNSGIGVCIACTTSSTRTLFSMARSGGLPKWLSAVHPTHRTPYRAVTLQFGVVIVLLVAMGIPLGAYNMFNLFGTTGTFTYVIIYGLGNAAAWRYFRTAGRDESSVIKYVVFPVVATAALLYIAYKSYIPLPAAPVVFAPVIVGVYAVVGAGCLMWALRPGRRDWMRRAGVMESLTEAPDTPAARIGSASLPAAAAPGQPGIDPQVPAREDIAE
jgi:amino acid transporter